MLREVPKKKTKGDEGAKVETAPQSKVKDQVEPCDLCAHEANPKDQVSVRAGRSASGATREGTKKVGGRARDALSHSPSPGADDGARCPPRNNSMFPP